MSRLFYHVMQDNIGNLLFDVTGTMRIAGSGTLATIYGDEALTVVLPNPMTNHPSFGSFKCFLGAGDYDFYMAKSGYTFETLTGVQGHGTLAQQNADNVAITGGVMAVFAANPGAFRAGDAGASPQMGFRGGVNVGTNKYNLLLDGSAQNSIFGPLGLGVGYTVPEPNFRLSIDVAKPATYGAKFKHSGSDTGSHAIVFTNMAGADVGSIGTTATATSYNTSSDGRLKEAIATLPHALQTLLALRPVQFQWKATGEVAQGFVAQDVQPLIPQAVTGDASDPLPTMQMDLSKLVPWLVAGLQELAQQVEVLTARLEAAGG